MLTKNCISVFCMCFDKFDWFFFIDQFFDFFPPIIKAEAQL